MRIKYIADDGTEFNCENNCKLYEQGLYDTIYNIKFFDNFGNLYHISKNNPYDDNVYQSAEIVILEDKTEVNAIQYLADMCGWSEFEKLNKAGIWVRYEDKIKNGFWKLIEEYNK